MTKLTMHSLKKGALSSSFLRSIIYKSKNIITFAKAMVIATLKLRCTQSKKYGNLYIYAKATMHEV